MTTHESFLLHARLRYLKLSLLLCLGSLAAYAWHDPVFGAGGDTWLGYTLGGIGAAIIVLLAALGIRKRRYGSNAGNVKGWLSAHVYLGLSLLIVVTLHTGFQFGWNIHTAAYVLMVAVIFSGVYGAVAYARYPAAITDNRDGLTRTLMLSEVMDLNEQALKLADKAGVEVHRIVVRSTERMRIGGGVRQQLFGNALRKSRTDPLEKLRQTLQRRLRNDAARKPASQSADMESTMAFMAGELVRSRSDEAENVQRLIDLLTRRNELVRRLNRDIQTHARMRVWLYFHVPLTLGLLAALAAHVVSVFLYW